MNKRAVKATVSMAAGCGFLVGLLLVGLMLGPVPRSVERSEVVMEKYEDLQSGFLSGSHTVYHLILSDGTDVTVSGAEYHTVGVGSPYTWTEADQGLAPMMGIVTVVMSVAGLVFLLYDGIPWYRRELKAEAEG